MGNRDKNDKCLRKIDISSLDRFLIKDTNFVKRQWAATPFIQNSMVVATDYHILFTSLVNNFKITELSKLPALKEPDVSKVINKHTSDKVFLINVNDAEKFIKTLPTAPETKVVKEEIQCEECEGDKIIEVQYTKTNGDEVYLDVICPFCDGTGLQQKEERVETGIWTLDPNILIMLNGTCIKASYFNMVIELCQEIHIKELYLSTSKDSVYFTSYKFKILCMGCNPSDSTLQVFSYKAKTLLKNETQLIKDIDYINNIY